MENSIILFSIQAKFHFQFRFYHKIVYLSITLAVIPKFLCLFRYGFWSLRSLIDKQVNSNVLAAKKSVHEHGNLKHWNNMPSIQKRSYTIILYSSQAKKWSLDSSNKKHFVNPMIENYFVWLHATLLHQTVWAKSVFMQPQLLCNIDSIIQSLYFFSQNATIIYWMKETNSCFLRIESKACVRIQQNLYTVFEWFDEATYRHNLF